MSQPEPPRVDDQSRPAEEVRQESLPDDSPLRPGAAAHVVDPATGEEHTGQ